MQDRKRLHISPFNPELLPAILNRSLRERATNISYHTIETFPERNYGYVELPSDFADKLKRKLNGCVLREQKMKIEEARPRKSPKTDNSENEGSATTKKRQRSTKKRTEEEGVIPAVELPKERKVKRGWTKSEAEKVDGKNSTKNTRKKEKKAKPKDISITGEAECLFKTKLPPNAQGSTHDETRKAKKRKRGVSEREAVVHEFENTTKHARFLRQKSSVQETKVTKEYVDGKGWVDEDGNLVEEAPKRRRESEEVARSGYADPEGKGKAETTKTVGRKASKAEPEAEQPGIEETDETSSSGSSLLQDEGDLEDGAKSSAKEDKQRENTRSRTKGLGISSIDGDKLQPAQVERLSISRSSGSPGSQHMNDQTPSEPATEVHPLEALFKLPKAAASQTQTPKKPHLELSTSFSFFASDANEAGNGDNSTLIPQTPFTQQDIRHRRQRSAAPTPDTAAPGKTFGDVWGGTMDDTESEDEEEEQATIGAGIEDGAVAKGKGKAKEETAEKRKESEFAKWFWEHRGENNRAWKRRRREAAKEKRVKDKKEEKG